MDTAEEYASAVVAGAIPACTWTSKACARHLADLSAAGEDAFPYRYDPELAAKACARVELLPHVKGTWARERQRLTLEPWQAFIVSSVFGWVEKATGLRRFRTVYIEVPRKNAKSTLSSAVGLCMLALDGEEGAEVYSAATTRDQARIVFADAQRMVRLSPDFREGLGVAVNAHNIHQLSTGSKFEALSAEGSTMDGLNVHCAIVDELHAHKTRTVFDVLETATGSRTQPLIWLITTAGSNRAGICYEQRTYLCKLLDGVAEDPSYFGVIYSIDEGDDWSAPEVWAKANPNYGVSVFPDDISRLARKALEMPSARNNFLTKRLNVWVNADTAWLDMHAWNRCADPRLCLEQFAGERCIVGLDLASKVDLSARVILFVRGGDYYAFGRYYVPEAAVDEARNASYSGWAYDGRLVATPGNVTDYEFILDDLRDLASRFELVEIAFDPYQATHLSNVMQAEGANMVEMRPTVLNFSEPMKELEALVLQGKFHHDGDPVMTWAASNVVCRRDEKDNIYPRKEREENKIDPIIALIMALGRLRAEPDGGLEVGDDYKVTVL